MKNKKNVFISHYSKDEEHVTKLKTLLLKSNYELRNSSIDSTKANDAKNPDYVKTLLRPGIKWAGTTIVLIGDKTHTREWVDWEIKKSFKEGNRIIGVYINGESDAEVPENFEKYGDALVGWDTKRIIGSIEGTINNWENPDGSPRTGKWSPYRGTC